MAKFLYETAMVMMSSMVRNLRILSGDNDIEDSSDLTWKDIKGDAIDNLRYLAKLMEDLKEGQSFPSIDSAIEDDED